MIHSKPNPDRRVRRARLPAATVVAALALAVLARPASAILMPSELWVASSGQAGAHFGWVVASAGDVNGDGFDDVLVGAPLAANGQVDEGRAFVFYGGQGGLSATPDWNAESNQAGAMFGAAVEGVGDVDGDGYDDVLIGAPLYDNGQVDEGAVFMYAGSDTGLSATPSWIVDGGQAGARFGAAIGGAGDVNFDGFDDALIGAPGYSNGQPLEGQARVYLGSDTGLNTVPIWTAESNHAGAQFGAAVSFGDINSDFMNDVVIGAPYDSVTLAGEGSVTIYLGKANGVNNASAWTAAGQRAHAHFGFSVAADGDVDGNGYQDVLVGAPGFGRGQHGEGIAYLYYATASGLATVPAWQAEGNQEGAAYGYVVRMLRDIDNDGFEDFGVGAPGFTGPRVRTGRVFIYLGQAQGEETPLPLAGVLDGNEAGGGFGNSIAAADVNHDLSFDLVAGSEYHSGTAINEGATRVFLFLGVIAGVNPGAASGLTIETIAPNPSHGRIRVSFVLPFDEPARLDLFDVAGRRVVTRDLVGFGAGRHQVDATEGAVLVPGLYFVRLAQHGASVTGRALVVR